MSAGETSLLSAAIVAGGMSRRMGTDKALIPLEPGGPSMIEIVIGRLREVADDVRIIAGGRPEYERFGVPVAPDDAADAGTLGGIATAVRLARHEHCLVVACDMPLLDEDLLRAMAAEPRDYDVLAPLVAGASRQGGTAFYQTLHAIYGKRCLGPIARQLAQGNRKVIGFFPEVRVRAFAEERVRAIDPDLHAFFNANSPEALEQVRAIARLRGS